MAVTRGIDISVWQRTVPQDAGEFVFCRGTYGEGVDARVEDHVRNARKRGLHVGLYGFAVPRGSGRAQADVLQRVAEKLNVTRVALDWESDGTNGMMRTDEARAFVDRLLDVRGECGLYMSSWQFRDIGQSWDWVARWGNLPPSWRGWEFHQYQGTPIDRNYFNGTSAQLAAFFNRTSVPEPRPVPRPQDPEPTGDDAMFNVAPLTTHRDVVLRSGTVLFRDSALKVRHSRVESETALGFAGSTAKAHAVINSGNTNYVRRDDAVRIVANDREFE